MEGRADFQLGMYSGVNGTGCCLVPVLRHRVGFRWLRLPVNNPWAQMRLGVRVCSRGGGEASAQVWDNATISEEPISKKRQVIVLRHCDNSPGS